MLAESKKEYGKQCGENTFFYFFRAAENCVKDCFKGYNSKNEQSNKNE